MPSTSFIVAMLASVFMPSISAKYSECLELRVSDYPTKCAAKCSGNAEKRLVNEHYLLTPNRPTCIDTMEKCCCGDLPGVCSEEKVLSYCRCNDKEYEEFTERYIRLCSSRPEQETPQYLAGRSSGEDVKIVKRDDTECTDMWDCCILEGCTDDEFKATCPPSKTV